MLLEYSARCCRELVLELVLGIGIGIGIGIAAWNWYWYWYWQLVFNSQAWQGSGRPKMKAPFSRLDSACENFVA